MTTVKTDVLVGFNEAFEELKKDLVKKLKNYKIFIKILTFYKLCDNIKWCMEIKYFE